MASHFNPLYTVRLLRDIIKAAYNINRLKNISIIL